MHAQQRDNKESQIKFLSKEQKNQLLSQSPRRALMNDDFNEGCFSQQLRLIQPTIIRQPRIIRKIIRLEDYPRTFSQQEIQIRPNKLKQSSLEITRNPQDLPRQSLQIQMRDPSPESLLNTSRTLPMGQKREIPFYQQKSQERFSDNTIERYPMDQFQAVKDEFNLQKKIHSTQLKMSKIPEQEEPIDQSNLPNSNQNSQQNHNLNIFKQIDDQEVKNEQQRQPKFNSRKNEFQNLNQGMRYTRPYYETSQDGSIQNRKTVNKPYNGSQVNNSFSQEKIIEKETFIKIEEKLPDLKSTTQLYLDQINELKQKLKKKGQKLKLIEKDQMNFKIQSAEQKIIIQNHQLQIKDLKERLRRVKSKHQETKDLIKQLQNLDQESFLKAELENKIQKIVEERISISRNSYVPEENQENLFTQDAQKNVLIAYSVQELEKQLQEMKEQNISLKQQLLNQSQDSKNDYFKALLKTKDERIRELESKLDDSSSKRFTFQNQPPSELHLNVENLLNEKNMMEKEYEQKLQYMKNIIQQKDEYQKSLEQRYLFSQKERDILQSQQNSKFSSKENEINIMKYKMGYMEEQLKLSQERLERSNQEIEDLKQIELNYFNQIKDLEAEIDLIENQKVSLQQQLEQDLLDTKQQYDKLIKQLKIEFENYQSELQQMNIDLKTQNHNQILENENNKQIIKQLENQIKCMEEGIDKEIRILESKLMDEIKTKESLEDELIQADQFIDELKQENDQLIKMNEETKGELQRVYDEMDNLQGYCQNLEDELEEREKIMKEKMNKKIATNEELFDRLQEMEDQYEKINEIFEIVRMDNETLVEEREVLIQQLKNSMEGIKELKQQIRSNDKEFQELDNNLKTNFNKFEDWIREKEALGNENLMLQNEIDKFQEIAEDQELHKEQLLMRIFHLSMYNELQERKKEVY